MKHTHATKLKLSAMRRGELNPFYGKKHTPEFRAAQSARTRAYNAERKYQPSPQQIVAPTDHVAAYLAGMIDADGSIRFRRGYPFVAIYNTHRPLMDWLMLVLKHGSISNGNKGRKTVRAWNVHAARDVYALITAVYPFLIVKRRDADAALEYLRGKYEWAL